MYFIFLSIFFMYFTIYKPVAKASAKKVAHRRLLVLEASVDVTRMPISRPRIVEVFCHNSEENDRS